MSESFRDPDGYVIHSGSNVWRCIYPHAVDRTKAFLDSPAARRWMSEGVLCRTGVVSPEEADHPREVGADVALLLRHEPVPFPSYPFEWPAEMLHAAARVTLRLAREADEAELALKDATPYNVMFRGTAPIFLDILSFSERTPLDPMWRPYAQFVQTFIYPLLAMRFAGLRPDELLSANRDGIGPERMLRLCPAWRLMTPALFGAVMLPALAGRRAEGGERRYVARQAGDAGEARYLLHRTFARAAKLLDQAAPPAPSGETVDYETTGHTYGKDALARKDDFVEAALRKHAPAWVLDIGANTGRYSRMAARAGARVVSVDKAPEASGALWRRAVKENADILPLAVDLARPTPAMGWMNGETRSFLERARGRFDCVLMLAVAHHLAVTERVPLARIFELAWELTSDVLVIEYVAPADSQFRQIARGRDELHTGMTQAAFEEAAALRFELAEACDVTPTRRLYCYRRKSG
ncbi:MAG: class I SAM-dependent methyltransferase [Acidobacteria bacterium]|nr:class I SAM-dependent methyltransferase [Acidobacteriota bacterium]